MINEIALFSLLGQGLLFLLTSKNRDQNFVYQIFKVVTNPIMKFTRLITPKIIIDSHIGFVAFFILIVFEITLIVTKIYVVYQLSSTNM